MLPKITTNFVTKFYPDITYLYILVFIINRGGGIQILNILKIPTSVNQSMYKTFDIFILF